MQTENTAPPGLTVIVGDEAEPQGTNWLAVTVTVAVEPAAVSVPAAADRLIAPPGSLANPIDQLTDQSPAPLPLRSIDRPGPFGRSTSVPPSG